MNWKSFSCFIFIFSVNLVFGQDYEGYRAVYERMDAYKEAGDFGSAAEAYDSIFNDYAFFINDADHILAAGIYVMAGNSERAYELLEEIVYREFGAYAKYGGLRENFHLLPLHHEDRWKMLLEQVTENYRVSMANLKADLMIELEVMHARFLGDRSYIHAYVDAYGEDSKEVKILRDTMAYNDSINQVELTAFLNIHGILSEKEVGEQGAATIFLVLNTCDTNCRIGYLEMVEKAFLDGKVRPLTYARFIDLLRYQTEGKQLYGTRVVYDKETEKYVIPPIHDPKNLDARRKAIGLKSMKIYARFMGLKWDLEEAINQENDNQ